MSPFQPSREKQLLGQPENESRCQQVFQKIPLQAQLRRKLQGHEDLEGKKEKSPGGSPGKVIKLSTQRLSGREKTIQSHPAHPLGLWPFRKKSCLLFKETFLPWEGVAIRFPTLVLLKGLEAFWLPLLLRL